MNFSMQLGALTALVSVLCWTWWRRHRTAWLQNYAQWESDHEFRKRWRPVALDAALIARQITHVRQNHPALASLRHRHIHRLRSTNSAREKILRLAYFTRANGETTEIVKGEGNKLAA